MKKNTLRFIASMLASTLMFTASAAPLPVYAEGSGTLEARFSDDLTDGAARFSLPAGQSTGDSYTEPLDREEWEALRSGGRSSSALQSLQAGDPYTIMMALQSKYPEGMSWTNSDTYKSKGVWYNEEGVAVGYGGGGCHGFALILSDAVYDDLPIVLHKDFNNIHPGDAIRLNNDTHTVMILKIEGDTITIAEGNFGGKIHWGRTISRTDTSTWTEILTRDQPDISTMECELTGTDFTYNGKAKTPGMIIGYLHEGEDFTLSYTNNVNAGVATVTATGIGKFKGSVTKEFTIKKADQQITADDITKKRSDPPFALSATANGGGALSYVSANSGVCTVDDAGTVTITGPGRTTITVTAAATDNYNAAAKTINVTVSDDSKKDISRAYVSGLASFRYTGSPIEPGPVVTLDNSILTEGRDYDVSYADNVNAGTALVTITGKGNFKGSVTATFKITKASIKISGKTISLKAKTVKKKNKSYSASKAFSVTKNKGTVTYKKTKGNNKITVSGKGKVTVKKGLKKGTYKIKVKVSAAGDANHKKAAKTVTVTVRVK